MFDLSDLIDNFFFCCVCILVLDILGLMSGDFIN